MVKTENYGDIFESHVYVPKRDLLARIQEIL